MECASFHDVRFPTAISRGATGGPERRTEIVTLGSGHEQRNARWAHSRRRYNAGYGVKSLSDIHEVLSFFEERRGRLFGFRWKDHGDFRSSRPGEAVTPLDQVIGTGDGETAHFPLCKFYGKSSAAYRREIRKAVAGTVRVAVDGECLIDGRDFTLVPSCGLVTFLDGRIPASGKTVTAGFEFDTPVRFDCDFLEISIMNFEAGQIPDIPILEVRL